MVCSAWPAGREPGTLVALGQVAAANRIKCGKRQSRYRRNAASEASWRLEQPGAAMLSTYQPNT